MKYRTKLYLSLLSTSLISSLLVTGILYQDARSQFIKQITTQVLSIASTTAALIDTNLLENFISHPVNSSSASAQLKHQLIRAKEANIGDDIWIKYIYIIKPSSNGELIYLIDSETDPKNLNPYGEIEPISDLIGLLEHQNLEKKYAPNYFLSDIYGTWLSGYAPIYNSQGQYLATVGVDISTNEIFEALREILRFEIIALIISLGVACIAAFILSRTATVSLKKLTTAVTAIGRGNLSKRITLKTKDEFHLMAESINTMAKGLEERERIQQNFARYVSSHVLERILKSDTPLKLEGERKKITILFSDVRQFTALSEQHSPEVVVSLLNEYFEKMIEIIFHNNGTLDKFLGDGLMVEFGAPLDDPLEERHAVETAIQMQNELQRLRSKWEEEGKPSIQMGIGIHTGIALLGTIGSAQRMEYTAIGDTVNVASRIQSITKTLQCDILISETTYAVIKDEFLLESLGPINLPGRNAPLTVYKVLGKNEEIQDNKNNEEK